MSILVLGNGEGGAGGRSSISSKSGGTAKYLSLESSNIEIYSICSSGGFCTQYVLLRLLNIIFILVVSSSYSHPFHIVLSFVNCSHVFSTTKW